MKGYSVVIIFLFSYSLAQQRDSRYLGGIFNSFSLEDDTPKAREASDTKVNSLLTEPKFDLKQKFLLQQQQQQHLTQSHTIVEIILRTLGIDSHKLREMTFNMFLYLAEYVAKTWLLNEKSDILTNEVPQYRNLVNQEGYISMIRKMLQNSEIHAKEWAEYLQDERLANNLIEELRNRTGSTTSCAQMLICKSTPLIRQIQKSSDFAPRSFDTNDWINYILHNIPSLDDIMTQSADCEDRFPSCPLFTF